MTLSSSPIPSNSLNKQSDIKQAIFWLLPTASEIVAYIGLGLLTVLVANIRAFRSSFLLPENFQVKKAIFDNIDNLLNLLTFHKTDVVVTAVFWAFIGLVVFLLFTVVLTFSSEFTNELGTRRYIYPKGANRNFIFRAYLQSMLLRLVALCLLLFYTFVVFGALMPWVLSHYVMQGGFNYSYIITVLGILLLEILMLHFFAILGRIIFLKKRIFGDYN